MRVIDVHSHIYRENGHDPGWEIPQAAPGPIGPESYVDAVGRSRLAQGGRMVVYAGSGIEKFREDATAVRGANEAAAELVAMAPELFILGFTPDPFHLQETLCMMEEWVKERGAKIVGEIVPYIAGHEREGPEIDAVYEKAAELGVPLNNHSSTTEDSAAIGRLAEKHPEARIIMAHIGGTWAFRDGIKVARAHENIWADTSGWPMVAGGIMEIALRELGASKLVFGTDYPLCDIDSWVSRLERLPVSDEDRERIAWRNAADLMGIGL
ncbi:MAG: amidohydrolase [Armatimonadota bacterium]|nr:MAG: amidohydrolase [Armatimonadota bacterium]